MADGWGPREFKVGGGKLEVWIGANNGACVAINDGKKRLEVSMGPEGARDVGLAILGWPSKEEIVERMSDHDRRARAEASMGIDAQRDANRALNESLDRLERAAEPEWPTAAHQGLRPVDWDAVNIMVLEAYLANHPRTDLEKICHAAARCQLDELRRKRAVKA